MKKNVAALSFFIIAAGLGLITYGIVLSRNSDSGSNTPSLVLGLGLVLLFVSVIMNVMGMMKQKKQSESKVK